MSSQFENFVQLELPKRPFLQDDVPEETIIVRRGANPRQLDGVVLAEGEVLGMDQGTLKGVELTGVGYAHTQALAVNVWTIIHNQNNRSVVITVLDSDHKNIIPDDITVTDNKIVITFAETQTGFANMAFI